MYYTRIETNLCGIILVGDEDGLQHLHLDSGEGKRRFNLSGDWQRDDDFFSGTAAQIRDYIAGRRTDFNVKLNPAGTEFQKRVWNELRRIPYGETRSYGEVAAALGKPAASRAVGAANGRNPVPLIVPCHRVIGAGGALSGYAHGVELKRRLLELERGHR